MRKFSWVLLVVGCREVVADDEGKAVKNLVEDEVVAEADPEKEIIWKKDGKEMVLIPAGSFQMGDHLEKMKNSLPVHEVEWEYAARGGQVGKRYPWGDDKTWQEIMPITKA